MIHSCQHHTQTAMYGLSQITSALYSWVEYRAANNSAVQQLQSGPTKCTYMVHNYGHKLGVGHLNDLCVLKSYKNNSNTP